MEGLVRRTRLTPPPPLASLHTRSTTPMGEDQHLHKSQRQVPSVPPPLTKLPSVRGAARQQHNTRSPHTGEQNKIRSGVSSLHNRYQSPSLAGTGASSRHNRYQSPSLAGTGASSRHNRYQSPPLSGSGASSLHSRYQSPPVWEQTSLTGLYLSHPPGRERSVSLPLAIVGTTRGRSHTDVLIPSLDLSNLSAQACAVYSTMPTAIEPRIVHIPPGKVSDLSAVGCMILEFTIENIMADETLRNVHAPPDRPHWRCSTCKMRFCIDNSLSRVVRKHSITRL
jgi:hypothetical protein